MDEKEARSAVMGAISMALKDPTLQQGFEIICKENAELREELNYANSHCLFHSDCPTQKESRSIQEEKLKLLSEYVSDLYVLGYSAKKIAELVQAKIADILGDKR